MGKEQNEKIKNVDTYYVVETPKRIYVTDSLKKAEAKIKAFGKIYNLNVKIKTFEQENLFKFIENDFSKKPIFLCPRK